MHFLLINDEFTVTGASTMFFQLAQHLVASGHQITITPIGKGDGPMRERFASLGPIATSVDLKQFDGAIGNTICAAPAVIHLGKTLPTIWWLHESEVGLNFLLKNQASIGAFDTAAAIIFQTEFQRDSVYRSFTYRRNPAELPVIPYGVALPEKFDRERVTPKRRAVRIVSVGSVQPRKRHYDLIQAVGLLPPDQVECVIVGKWFTLPEDAQDTVRKNKHQFHFTDEVLPTEAVAWIESCDIFCLCSASESFPIAPLEAALLGKPIVLSDLHCYHTAYEHGRSCLFFPVGNIPLLTMSIQLLLDHPQLREQLGDAARRAAISYTPEAFFARFDALLAWVISRGAAHHR